MDSDHIHLVSFTRNIHIPCVEAQYVLEHSAFLGSNSMSFIKYCATTQHILCSCSCSQRL